MLMGSASKSKPERAADGEEDARRDLRQVVAAGVSAAWPVLLLVVVFAVMQRWARGTLRLPEEAYRSPIMTLEIVQTMATSLAGLVALAALLLLAIVRRTELAGRWPESEGAGGVRTLVLLTMLWATWATVTLDHNLFYDQSYDVDRLILIALVGFAFWRPVFVIPHVFLFVALEHQFDHPLGRQIFSRVILEDLLLLFAAAVVVRGLTRRHETRAFLFVAACLLASYYWYPGYVKLARGWFWHGQLYLGGFASYANGWLASLPVERVESLMKIGAALDWPGRVLTLATELGALVFFVHRAVPRLLLSAWAMLHIGIWLFSGVSFLVWIAIDLAFLGLFFLRLERCPPFFSRWFAVGGAALMLASPIWVQPPGVGWFDTRLVYTYRYEAVDDRGERAAFPADATPLGQAWCARDFPFLSHHPTLLVRYGKTNDRALAETLAGLESAEAVFALEEARGQVYYDEEQARELDRFLGEVAEHWNQRGSQEHWLGWAAPPRTCLSPRFSPEPLIGSDRIVRRIIVHQLTFLFDGRTFREIRRIPVRTIDLSA